MSPSLQSHDISVNVYKQFILKREIRDPMQNLQCSVKVCKNNFGNYTF